MTCQDCIHFDADKHPTINGVVSIAGHCDKRVADGYDEYPMPDCDVCDMFVINDGSYYDGHWHCHRCGKIVEVGGLCVDCDRMLDSWESVSK